MKKKIHHILLLLVLAMLVLLCGCGESRKTTKDVDEYLKSELNIEKYEYVSENVDGIWTVRLKDSSGVEFHVVEVTVDQLFGVSYSLYDDYASMAADYETRNYPFKTIEKTVKEEDEYGIITVRFSGSYTDRSSMNDLLAEMDELLSYVQASEHPVSLGLDFHFDNPLFALADFDDVESAADDADYSASASAITEDIRKELTQRMVIMAKCYRFEDVLAEFSEAEVKDCIANSNSCIGICYGNPERDEYTYYDDICGTIYGGKLSYPTLYQILIREGYPLDGSESHYTLTGVDQETYEFFYDLNGELKYLKGSEVIDTTGAIHPARVKEMTGLNLLVWKMDYQPNKDVYAEDGSINYIANIYLNGQEMTYDTVREGKFLNTTDDYKYLFYNKEEQCYMITLDIGLTTDTGSYPCIAAEWVKALGGTYTRKDAKKHHYETRWVIGKNKYIVTSEFKDNEVLDFSVKKNKKKFELPYETNNSQYHCSAFCIMLRVDDFARLFDLTYEISQEDEAVYFQSK